MINNMKGDMQERLVYARRLIGCRRDLRLEISHGTHGRTRKDKTREILIKRCRMAKRLRSQHVISMGTACRPLPILRSAARRVRFTHRVYHLSVVTMARKARPMQITWHKKKPRFRGLFNQPERYESELVGITHVNRVLVHLDGTRDTECRLG